MTSNAHRDLHALVRRYQRALLAKGGLLTLVGAALVAVLAWRLAHTQAAAVWSMLLPTIAGLAGAAALWMWWKRHSLSRATTIRQLDDTLGLEQRLITLEQFERTAHPPLLFPLLERDTQQRCSAGPQRVPRLMDRTSGLLTVALLILLLWPGAGRLPVPFAPRESPAESPTPPDRESPPPPPEPSESSAESEDSESAPAPGQSSSSPPSAPSDQQPADEGTGDSDQPSEDASSQGEDGGRSPQASEGDGTDQSSQGQPSSDAGDQRRDASSAGRTDTSSQEQAAGQPREQQPSRSAESSSERASGGRDGQGAQAEQRQAASEDGGRDQAGRSFGKQQALRGDIKELLEELRGELQTLQAQLEARQDEFSSGEPGTASDPELYDAAESLEQGALGQRALPLQTDAEPTTSMRPGGGFGGPSDEIAEAVPQQQPQAAQLSDQPHEELAGHRMVVPPEYRAVLETLRQRDQQPMRPDE